jgi:P-type Ca2+ transporter type 2C
MDIFNRLLDTVPLTAAQLSLALAAAVLLLVLWEVGKLPARRRSSRSETGSSDATAAEFDRRSLTAAAA